MDKLYLGTNTKMYKTIADTVDFLTRLAANTADLSRDALELFVIPSFTTLGEARQCVPRESITLGAQNMGWEDQGQFTGEISPLMLREVGVEIVEIGHSERRHVLHETDEEENRKVLCALRHGLRPLLCIGETAQQKAQGIADEILRIQLKIGLQGMDPAQADRLMIAYEPVWAIGVSGVPASADYAQEKHAVIKRTLAELLGEDAQVPVLYGGSVNDGNCEELIALPAVDGLFIGRSAWDADRFDGIIRKVLRRLGTDAGKREE
ncbi:MAG: triose-phosphate isomerase [Clostridiales bacterium]|nr:triose-phosphate isomerase [Clostridiales bacterium]